MPSKRLPRVFLVRHGETEWTINGRHTGITDLPLTANGEAIIKRLGEKVAGTGKLVDPALLQLIMVSPRQRARRTFELLFASLDQRPDIQIDERVREWTYGAYEGKYKREVVAMRKEKDLPSGESGWDIWHDGCEEGETAAQMTARVDDVVNAVRSAHKVWHETSQPDEQGGDILIISHGHFSRCFLARWLGLPLELGKAFILDPGGVCVGQYYHDLDHTAVGSINLGLL